MTSRISAFCLGLAFVIVVTLSAAPVTAHAELGDYSGLQTLRNLVSPPRADRPVRAEERHGAYPLLGNPSGFDDGFTPGKYLVWQTVRAAPETGAVCGNGSPYKFFVNRVPGSRNTLFVFEGGGACWDFESCTGSVRNPNGIADDYMSFNQLASPFTFRLHPTDRVKTQNWNIVYAPYCTGDTYTGDRVATYPNSDGSKPPLVWHFNGLRNTRAVVAWVRDHLPRAPQLLSWGCSAGGVGTLTNYHHVRRDLAPDRGFMINDSGPVFPTIDSTDPRTPITSPSVYLHRKIRAEWGLDEGLLSILKAELPGFTLGDIGSINTALAARWNNDRLGHVHFWDDLVYSRYSYASFYPEIRNEPDALKRDALQLEKWRVDTEKLRVQLAGVSNSGGYFPRFRDVLQSHCASVIGFADADIQEQRLELRDFIASVLDGTGAVLDASESDTQADRAKPRNLLYWLIDNGKDVLSRLKELIGGVFG